MSLGQFSSDHNQEEWSLSCDYMLRQQEFACQFLSNETADSGVLTKKTSCGFNANWSETMRKVAFDFQAHNLILK